MTAVEQRPVPATGRGARRHAVSVGLRRGWTEFLLSLKAPQDLAFYLVWAGGLVIYLFVNRNDTVEGTSLLLGVVALPGLLAALLTFSVVIGPAMGLVVEREDGTLLRAKAAPHGMTGYVTGQVVLQSVGVLPLLALILIPSAFFLHPLMYRGVLGWLAVVLILVLGLVALLPIGLVIGSLATKPSQVSTWGMLPIIGLVVISGIFAPVQALWNWVQVVAQVFPLYWLGHAMRWAFLPDEAAVLELGGQWNLLGAVLVVGAWGVVGLLLAPRILRRMARRESGSAVQARFEERLQRYG